MFKRFRYYWQPLLLALTSGLMVSTSHALDTVQNDDWTLRKDNNGIKVYTSRVAESKFKAVKASTYFNASVGRLVGVIQDASLCAEWADRCKDSKIVETISDSEYYLYAYSNMPFPVRDRDAVMHINWSYAPESGQVVMTGVAASGYYPKTKAARIDEAQSKWVFTPQTDGTTLVESTIHADPNGAIPPWIVNMLISESPFKSFTKLKALVEADDFIDREVPFLAAN